MGGVTDLLTDAADCAARGDTSYEEPVGRVIRMHSDALAGLIPEGDRADLQARLDAWVTNLDDLLHGVMLVRECTDRSRDRILSFGELASSMLVAAALGQEGSEARVVDARELIVTDRTFGNAIVDRDATNAKARAIFEGPPRTTVVPGFIAATPEGDTSTLGRGGSDYTAALLGAALGAERVEIWTDVDGVMSADPRLVPEAFSLGTLSWQWRFGWRRPDRPRGGWDPYG